MTNPRPPLTPASSTEIAAMEKGCFMEEMYFTLPPAAIADHCPPLSPTSPVAPDHATGTSSRGLRQRSSTKRAAASGDKFSLPPPPTRKRKIIQMEPKSQDKAPSSTSASSRSKTKADDDGNYSSSQDGPPKPKKSTAAGRKVARRTAHSLIERRRRSKMNQEFATLKDMIPACNGHEMHKLAILQASVEYVNYLETCVSELKNANKKRDSTPTSSTSPLSTRPEGDSTTSGTSTCSLSPNLDSYPTSTNTSPLERVQDCTSISPLEIIPIVLPSPSFPPINSRSFTPRPQPQISSGSTSTLSKPKATSIDTSPMIMSQQCEPSYTVSPRHSITTDMDREATTALLMLNNDRRIPATHTQPEQSNTKGERRRCGISVQDLLSH